MNIHPIRTHRDHAVALRRIDELMDAEPGSAESNELDALATLVQSYEDRHFPIDDAEPTESLVGRD